MKNIILIIKGFLFGTANIIPGVSGGTMAIILGVYEKLLNVLGRFNKNIKENLRFLIPFGFGIFIAIFIMSNLISYALTNHHLVTSLFFVGLIIGGLPPLLKKVKNNKEKNNYIYFVVSFLIVIAMTISKNSLSNNYVDLSSTSFIVLFLVGAIVSTAMIIPGISGSFVLVLLGFYEPILSSIKDILLFNNFIFNFIILLFFGLGVLVGIVYMSRLIEYLIKKHEKQTYFSVIGFVLASIISIVSSVSFETSLILYSLISFVLGIIISLKLGEW